MKNPSAGARSAALGLLLTLAAGGALAQTVLNPRWHGTWQTTPQGHAPGETSRLVITAEGIRTPEMNCRWVAARPKNRPKACVSFYDAGVPKSQLTTMFDQAEREIRRQSADKQSPLAPEDRKRLLDDLARHRRVLAEVSDEVFRSVALDAESLEGDCTSFYFIDKDFLYEATSCPYPEAHDLKQYRKRP